MKKGVLITLAGLLAGTSLVVAQNRDVISSRPEAGTVERTVNAGTREQNSQVFTNSTGETYTVQELATQLRELRRVVDETLPALTAFNQTFGANVADEGLSVGGAISEALGALGRGGDRREGSTNSMLSVLGDLLSTNAPGGLTTDERTVRQLSSIEAHLQPVEKALDALNVARTPLEENRRDSTGQEPLTPTGRDEQFQRPRATDPEL